MIKFDRLRADQISAHHLGLAKFEAFGKPNEFKMWLTGDRVADRLKSRFKNTRNSGARSALRFVPFKLNLGNDRLILFFDRRAINIENSGRFLFFAG